MGSGNFATRTIGGNTYQLIPKSAANGGKWGWIKMDSQ